MAMHRRKDRVMRILHTLPVVAQQAIVDSLDPADRTRHGIGLAHGVPR
jgi:phospholipid/cholesterol/gamma-HCH transport system ATP-binding protein